MAVLNEIYDVCGPAVLGKSSAPEPMCSHILLSVGQEESVAVAVNSFMLTKLPINNENLSGDYGEYLLPVVKLPKRADSVTIENSEDEINLSFDNDAKTKISQGMPYGEFIHWKRLIPDRISTYEIGVCPKSLIRAAKSLEKRTDVAKLSFGEKAMDPILITTPRTGITTILMPGRLENNE